MTVSQAIFPTTDLIRFLLARADDEDEQARRLSRSARGASGVVLDAPLLARQRAETAARRQVIGHVQQLLVLRDQPNEKAVRDIAAQVLRSMSVPYEDHPSFRTEWRPAARL